MITSKRSKDAHLGRFLRSREIIAISLAAGIVVGGTHAACTPRTPAQAEAAYTAELLRCVDRAATLAASRACRAEVNQRWGVKP